MPPRLLALALTSFILFTTLGCAAIRREPHGAPADVLCGIDVLERNGFKVTVAPDAVAALDHLKLGPVEGILCDVILPGIDGTSFYEELLSVFPDMAARVVFLTGWTRDDKVVKLLEYTGRPVLHKPVEAAELVHAMRAIDLPQ